jgi:hypothetical protein
MNLKQIDAKELLKLQTSIMKEHKSDGVARGKNSRS